MEGGDLWEEDCEGDEPNRLAPMWLELTVAGNGGLYRAPPSINKNIKYVYINQMWGPLPSLSFSL